jgi:hypothetical protein
MEYTIKLNEQQVELLKSILAQIEPMALINIPIVQPKKLTKLQQTILNRNEYRAMKAARKTARKTNI